MFILIRPGIILSLAVINICITVKFHHNPFAAMVSLSASLLSAHRSVPHKKDVSSHEKLSLNIE